MKKKAFTGKRRDKPIGVSEKLICILKIINYLEQDKYPSAQALAEICEVSKRSIYRYLRIIDSVIPVIYEREGGGYKFLDKAALKNIQFDNAEHALFITLLNAVSRLPEPIKALAKGIKDKIYSSGTGREVLSDKFPLYRPPTKSWQFLDRLFSASMQKNQVALEYSDIKGQNLKMVIDPHDITCLDGIWLLRAYCHNTKDYRWFVLDRIKSVTLLDMKFEEPGGGPNERYKHDWDSWEEEVLKVRLRFSPEAAPMITSKDSWHPSEKRETLPSGAVELSLKVSTLEEIQPWVYSWTPYVEVLEPKSLRNKMKKDTKKALSIYE